jgi:hypothetical protein
MRPETEALIIRYYYPALYSAHIYNREEYFARREQMVDRTIGLLSEDRIKHYEVVQTFYDIGQDAVNYITRGIVNIRIRIKNSQSKTTNLEMIFKNMHASRDMPYIKYNPGNRRENLYRFYYQKITKTGKKVPQLEKSQILKMSKETGAANQISVYLRNVAERVSTCYLHFDNNGDVQIQLLFASPQSEERVEEIIVQNIRPKLDSILKTVKQTGYSSD